MKALLSAGTPSGKAPEAYSVMERMKGRGFLEELGPARRITDEKISRQLKQKQALEARLRWLDGQTASP